jgi:AraC-like DNA-binding protein
MKKYSLVDLYDMEFSVKNVSALKQFWTKKTNFSCMGEPKNHNLLLYINNCEAVYTFKDGATFTAEKGSIVYTPMGAEYSVRFLGADETEFNTIGIRFLLFDENGDPFVLSDNSEIIAADNANYKSLFLKMDNYSEANIVCIGKIKSVMYDLLFKISSYYRTDYTKKFKVISKGITYLEQEEEQILSIKELADMCNVSEAYFRRLFKLLVGVSPRQYVLTLRIQKAKQMLSEGRERVQTIADECGFESGAHFSRTFKKHVGMTPAEYRIKNRIGSI